MLFLRVGNGLQESGWAELAEWTTALEQGSHVVSELGGAKSGDRTMLDALNPFVSSLKSAGPTASPEVLLGRGADATPQMRPKFGRSSYLQARVLGYNDPGAEAITIWLQAVVGALLSPQIARLRQVSYGPDLLA